MLKKFDPSPKHKSYPLIIYFFGLSKTLLKLYAGTKKNITAYIAESVGYLTHK